MDFWDKLTKKASETYKGASEKTSKIAKETKLKLKINENKSKIEDLYTDIGKKVYQKHVAKEDVKVAIDIQEECAKIDELAHQIEEYERQIWDLSDNKQCPKCKSKISKEVTFCPNCGLKQEEEKVHEVEVVEEVKEDDLKEEPIEEYSEGEETKTNQESEEAVSEEDTNNE